MSVRELVVNLFGTPTTIYIPNYAPQCTTVQQTTLPQALANYWYVDGLYTILATTTADANKARAYGFVNVIDCTGHVNDRITLYNGNYIVINLAGNHFGTLYNSSDVEIGWLGSGETVFSFPNIGVEGSGGTAQYLFWERFDNNNTRARYGPNYHGSLTYAEWISFLEGADPPPPPTDPYSWAGHSHTSGKIPDEQHQIVQQNVDFPTLPTASFGDGGFVSIWTPELDEVQRIAGYAWNGNLLSIDFWKKLVASPLDLIFGLQIIPYDFADENSPYTYKHAPLTLGYINTQIDTHYIDEQFIEVDMGSVDLKEWAGAYLDYDPYTRFQIYLPYIGVKDLNADDCMNRTLSLKYRIDIASGACVAMIKCTDIAEDGTVDSIFYSFPGNCAAQVPVTASQQQSLIQSIVGIGIGVASAVSTIAAPPVALAAGAGAGAMAGMMGASGSPAAGALGLKSHYEHSGNMGSTIGFLGVQKPYILINRPRLAIPEDQNVYMGYPSFITESLGDLEGFTQVEIIHMENMTCTEEEVREIERLLVEGVIF